ncbi:MAG: D-alanyl-D-alanine carboxypeptidase [Clostridia bacterium]|nr:D-alanyl-D-alanine carboxypeptidase [Clostridia bacterium]MBQ9807185.1 D-alanyl-D-alanine carboxypeptidase [Clostridia bacterium]
MKQKMLRWTAILLAVLFLPSWLFVNTAAQEDVAETEDSVPVTEFGVEDSSLSLNCKSAILMEATTGTVLYTQNAEEALPPASVTKIMTLLLVMEEIDAERVRLDDTVTVSANAASMGGSQVYLKEGEQMTVEDLLKSVVIASANDAAVALAEHVAGSVSVFVDKMNAKARELGMTATCFENVTGLDDTAERHLTSAKDIALMSQALLGHPTVLQYSSIWMDTIRDGAFGLTNTNRLVRFYRGCTGLKTGSTSKAGFCVSVTAERDGFSLICVIMGAESGDSRNAAATQLLDWGFANYGLYRAQEGCTEPIPVTGGVSDFCETEYSSFTKVLPKSDLKTVETRFSVPESLAAPIRAGEALGRVEYLSGKKVLGSVEVRAAKAVEKINFFTIFGRMVAKFLLI